MGRYTLEFDDTTAGEDDHDSDNGNDTSMEGTSTAINYQSFPISPLELARRGIASFWQQQAENDTSTSHGEHVTSISSSSNSIVVAEHSSIAEPQANQQQQRHYHIYIPTEAFNQFRPSFNQDGATSSRGKGFWVFVAAFAVLVQLLLLYGPSVPPPATDTRTWSDFWWHQYQLWKDIFHHTWFWTLAAIKHDVSDIISPSTPLQKCQKTWATELPDSSSQASHPSYRIIGQEVAWKSLQLAWKQHFSNSTTKNHVTSSMPLVLFAMGGPGTGKRYLAHLLIEKFLFRKEGAPRSCGQNDNSSLMVSKRILELDAARLLANGHFDASWQDTIHQHTQVFPDGCIISMTHVDQWPNPARLLLELDQLISSLYATTNSATLHNAVFLLTSSTLGTTTIEKTLRIYGREALPRMELESFLQYELADYYASDSETRTFTPSILPFLPLEKKQILQLFQWKVQEKIVSLPCFLSTTTFEWKISGSFLADALEWHSWRHKSSGEEQLVVAAGGAKPMLRFVTGMLQENDASWNRCCETKDMNKDIEAAKGLMLQVDGLATNPRSLRFSVCEVYEQPQRYGSRRVESVEERPCQTLCTIDLD